jgi:hypothetical protein
VADTTQRQQYWQYYINRQIGHFHSLFAGNWRRYRDGQLENKEFMQTVAEEFIQYKKMG